MTISNGLKKKFVFLMSVPLVFFGMSFKTVSNPIPLELEKPKNPEIDENNPAETQNNKIIQNNNRDYLLPLEKILMPVKKAGKEDILINAKAVLAIDYYTGSVLYEKDADQKVKIASLTKLATAGAFFDFIKTNKNIEIPDEKEYNLDKFITISKSAVDAEGDSAKLIIGEKIKAGDLLKMMLISSSNDAAMAIAEDVSKLNIQNEHGIEYFIKLMNDFAKQKGLAETRFANPIGIDDQNNYSTAKDVVKLARIILRDYPEIFEITGIDAINIKSADSKNDHFIKNTNELLGNLPGIIGGKTGYTSEAGESLLLIVYDSALRHQIIAVVIGAEGRFAEMERLVNWIWDSHEWK